MIVPTDRGGHRWLLSERSPPHLLTGRALGSPLTHADNLPLRVDVAYGSHYTVTFHYLISRNSYEFTDEGAINLLLGSK